MAIVPYTRHRSKQPDLSYAEVESYPAQSNSIHAVTITASTDGSFMDTLDGTYIRNFTIVFTAISFSPTDTIVNALSGFRKTYSYTENKRYYTGLPTVKHMFKEAFAQACEDEINKLASGLTEAELVEILAERKIQAISDVPTTNFDSRIQRGEVINNPVLNDKCSQRVVYTPGKPPPAFTAVCTNDSSYQRIYVSFEPGDTFARVPPSIEVMLARLDVDANRSFGGSQSSLQLAINKAYGNINAGSYNYGEELGEAKETFNYLIKVFSRIAQMFKTIKNGKFAGIAPRTHARVRKEARSRARRNGTSMNVEYAKIAAGFITSAWMELRFAIRPLVYSVEDAVKLYNEGLKARAGRITSNHSEIDGSIEELDESYDDEVCSYNVKTKVNVVRKCTAGVLLENNINSAAMRQLGFTNFAGVIWELTWLSWAVDYFVDLSGFLYKVTPNVGVTPLAAWSSTLDTITVETVVTRTALGGGPVLDTVKYFTDRTLYHREPISSPSNFVVDVDLDIFKITDLASVFYGLYNSALDSRRKTSARKLL